MGGLPQVVGLGGRHLYPLSHLADPLQILLRILQSPISLTLFKTKHPRRAVPSIYHSGTEGLDWWPGQASRRRAPKSEMEPGANHKGIGEGDRGRTLQREQCDGGSVPGREALSLSGFLLTLRQEVHDLPGSRPWQQPWFAVFMFPDGRERCGLLCGRTWRLSLRKRGLELQAVVNQLM